MSSNQPEQLTKAIYETLSPCAIAGFLENTPIAVINNLHIYEGEVGNVDSREIKGSFNNSALNNVNIQSEILREYQLSEKDFENLESDINEADISETAREQNRLFLENLKASLNEHDKETAKRIVGWIKDSIGNVSSVITIASVL